MFGSIRARIALVGLLPLLLAVFYMGRGIMDNLEMLSAMERSEYSARLAVRIGNLIHEVQRERGASAGYLSRGEAGFLELLRKQRRLTDRRLRELHAFIAGEQAVLPERAQQPFQQALARLDELPVLREQVDGRMLEVQSALDRYTAINTRLLGTLEAAANASVRMEVARLYKAYIWFMQAKERAGIERAVLSAAFSSDRFQAGQAVLFIRLLEGQALYLRQFLSVASDEERALLQETLNRPVMGEVQAMRDIALKHIEDGSLGGFGQDAGHWFATMTRKIDLYKKVEDRLAADLGALVGRLHAEAGSRLAGMTTLSVLALLAVMFTAWWVARGITGSLRQCVSFACRIAGGELGSRLEGTGMTETDRLVSALNRMADDLGSMIRRLADTSGVLSETADTISENAQSMSRHIDRQQDETRQVAASMSEMARSVRRVGEHAGEAAEAADVALQQAEQGDALMKGVREAVNGLATEVTASAEAVQSLEQRSQSIGGIIETIQAIAEQTNLLALNAAIEAARAGEQGRGFAVVADEVRDLAGRTQEATREINGMIAQLHEDIDRVVERMEQGRGRAADAVEETERAMQGLQRISLAVEAISEMNGRIAQTTREQSEMAGEIDGNLEAISRSTGEAARMGQENLQIGERLARLAQELQEKLRQFSL